MRVVCECEEGSIMVSSSGRAQLKTDGSRTPTTAAQQRLAGSLSVSRVHKQAKLAAIGGGFVPEFFERVEKDQKVRNTRKLGEEVGHMCRWGFWGYKRERGAALMPRMSWNVSRTECVINRW